MPITFTEEYAGSGQAVSKLLRPNYTLFEALKLPSFVPAQTVKLAILIRKFFTEILKSSLEDSISNLGILNRVTLLLDYLKFISSIS